jgi:predicted ATP-dependent serine protease
MKSLSGLDAVPNAGIWNTLIETAAKNESRQTSKSGLLQTLPLSTVNSMEDSRISSGIGELDRVLVGGEPGIGKFTLLSQLAVAAETKGRILYVSGEESAYQLKLRADNWYVLCRRGRIHMLKFPPTGLRLLFKVLFSPAVQPSQIPVLTRFGT